MVKSATTTPIMTPQQLIAQHPLSDAAKQTVINARQAIANILDDKDNRLLVVVGPCSIHDPFSALDYAKRLKTCIQKYKETLCIVMRTYFEKPRTQVGWKGFINDPDLNMQYNIPKGLSLARSLLCTINELGVPAGTELLNPLTTPYLMDLLSWSVIGARTVESQLHRELASSLPTPVGFKNSTSGNRLVAMDAMMVAANPHHFLGTDLTGDINTVSSSGNRHTHIILRGSQTQPNYTCDVFDETQLTLISHGLNPKIMIDCSHGNSQKNPDKQSAIVAHLANRIENNTQSPFGIMLESYLVSGKQALSNNTALTYGQSVTDPCISWEATEKALDQLSRAVTASRKKHATLLGNRS